MCIRDRRILGKPLLRLTHRTQQTVLQICLPAKGVYQPLGFIIRHGDVYKRQPRW